MGNRFTIGTRELWTPANISTVAWFDAADSDKIIKSGDKVSQWTDKSGNGNHATNGAAASQPTYYPSDLSMNNMGSIGSTDTNGNIGLITPSFGSKICYAVVRSDETTFSTYTCLFSGSLANGKFGGRGQVGTTRWRISDELQFNDSTYKNGSTTDTNLNILPMPTATLFRFEASNLRTQRYYLGYYNHISDRSWKGAYSEFIFTDGTEGLATKQKIEGYLAWKWGIA